MLKRNTKNSFRNTVIASFIFFILIIGTYYYFSYQRLEYKMDSVSVSNININGLTLDLYIRVINPNLLPNYITSTRFDIYLNDQFAGYGNSDAMTVSGNGFRTLNIPVYISYTGLAQGIIDALIAGKQVNLDLIGEARFFVIGFPFEISHVLV